MMTISAIATATLWSITGAKRGADVVDGCCDGHRHRHHVVDEKRASDDDPSVGTKVDGCDLVVATTTGVRVHILPVRSDDDEEHEHDASRDPRRITQEGSATDGEDDQDLLCRIRVGR